MANLVRGQGNSLRGIEKLVRKLSEQELTKESYCSMLEFDFQQASRKKQSVDPV